jgi:glycosyltransferase involved in cell wall biosynthesis
MSRIFTTRFELTPDADPLKSIRRPRIGFVHRFDARKISSWSGIFFFMAKALEDHVGEVVYLGPDSSAGTKFIIDNTARVNRFWQRLTGKTLTSDKNRFLSRRLARFFERRIQESPCDILFAPVASVEIASLSTDLPIVYFSDITWKQIADYYPEFSGISDFGRAEAERIEADAIHRANACVYPSDWAADSARDDYGSRPDFTFKASFGANLNEPPARSEALSHSLNGPVHLLLVGVDWVRKGGPIAFECLTSLLEKGVDARLTIMGCVPPAGFEHQRLQVIPFLDKHDPEQRKKITQLFLDAHFMLLPTRADATPIVTCEASAFGLPTLASDTGGLAGSIRNGVNGFLLPFEARGAAYAGKIVEVISDPVQYAALVTSSRDEFERNLNWDTWGRTMRGIMERVLNRSIDPGEPADRNSIEQDRYPSEAADPLQHHSGSSSEVADGLAAAASHS